MGGVLINGCGAAEKNELMRFLKTDYCPYCHKEQDFYVSKIRMKIHVIYIPTIPVSTKYGIVCKKCKTGRYISKEQMQRLLACNSSECEKIYDEVMSGDAQPMTPPDIRGQIADPATCPKCGKESPSGSAYCAYCGEKLPENVKPTVDETFQCTQCGKRNPVDSTYCGFCGAKRETDESVTVQIHEVKEPEVPVSDSVDGWICSLCGTQNTEENECCILCGQKKD